MKSLFGFAILICALSYGILACDDGPKALSNGDSCKVNTECGSGLCSYGHCLDPLADDDNDGLINALEAALGSNPFNPDTDGDGILDKDEVGPNGEPVDTDGDGIPDILESAILDKDGDCLPDQYDPDDMNMASREELQKWGTYLCRQEGVCEGHADAIILSCSDAAVLSCDYSAVPDYAEDELCDGLDNNCDGRVDEGYPDMNHDGVADCVDPDRDGDGVENELDNCPDVPNPDQWDANGNAKGDACDPPLLPKIMGFSPSSPGSGPHLQLLGEGEAFSTTKIYGDPLCETLLGSVEVNEAKEWSFKLEAAEGENVFYLRAENRYLLESSCGPGGMSYMRDESIPPSPRFRAASATDWDGDELTVDGSARFLIEGDISGHGVRVLAFSDAQCTQAVGEGESDEAGRFQVESDWITIEKPDLYIAAESEAGVLGECMPTQAVFGQLLVPLRDLEGNLKGGIPVQIHYPDGSPASEVRWTSSSTLLYFESFLAGSTVTFMNEPSNADSEEKDVSTFASIVPNESFHFPAVDNGDWDPWDGFPEDEEGEVYSQSISWPETSPEAWYVRFLFPGGSESYFANNGSGTFQVNPRLFQGEHFDLALMALDRNYEPLAYLVMEDVPKPNEDNGLGIDLSGESWQEEGWFESVVTLDLDGYYEIHMETQLLGENHEVLGQLDYIESSVAPGEERLHFKSPPLPNSRVHLLLSLFEERDETVGRLWQSELEGESLPLEKRIDLHSGIFPRLRSMELEVFHESDGLRQVEVNFRHLGSFEKADLLMFAIQKYLYNAESPEFNWTYYSKGGELSKIVLPRLSVEWEPHLGAIRNLPSEPWIAGIIAFKYFTKRAYSTHFRNLPFLRAGNAIFQRDFRSLQEVFAYEKLFFE